MASPLDALSFREIYGRTLKREDRGREHAFVVTPFYQGMQRWEELSMLETVRKSLYRCVDYGEVYYVSREMTEYLWDLIHSPRLKADRLFHLDQGDLPSLVGFVYFDGPVPMPTLYSKTGFQNMQAILWDQFSHDNDPRPDSGKPGLYFGNPDDPNDKRTRISHGAPQGFEVVGKILYTIVESPNQKERDQFGPWKPRHWIPAQYGMRWSPDMVNWAHRDEPIGIRDNLSPMDQEKDRADSEAAMRIVFDMLQAWYVTIQQEIPVLHPRPAAYDKVMHKEGRLPVDVKVTHLRRYEQRPATGLVEVDWAYRWRVKEHYRLQRVGPGRMFIRKTLVKSHVKGPPDKPLIERDTITSLDR
jgi:hypothetical protein